MSHSADKAVTVLADWVLRTASPAPAATGDAEFIEHLEDEQLALFAAGALTGKEHESVIAHLADCDDCREVVAQLLHVSTEEETQLVSTRLCPALSSAMPRRLRFARIAAWAALAAALSGLIVTTIWRNSGSSVANKDPLDETAGLLARGDFEEARERLTAAAKQGAASDRMLSLQSQVARRIPAELALSHAGRLSDFGFGVGGVSARGARDPQGLEEAQVLLRKAGDHEMSVVLNRAHLSLSLGDDRAAYDQFAAACQQWPDEPLAWLGRGLAEFLLDDFKSAESSFRHCLDLDSRNISAAINLAMTLEEQGKRIESIQQWEKLRDRKDLSRDDQRQVNRAIQQLRQSP